MQSPPSPFKKYVFLGAKMGLFPLAFYLFFYCVLTYPAILFFTTHFFADCWDGMGNAYGLWWINQALTQLHQSPWHTTLLHFPYGISLRGTPSPLFNGLLAIPLLKFLTLAQTYNVLLLFGFVMGGLTAFWLAHAVTKSYWPSLIGGYIFTFSNYHFAHAIGHLNLVSLEWIPLFILFWYLLITKPRMLWGAAAALFLYATFLCDYYYALVCFLSACLMVLWRAVQKKDAFFLLCREYRAPLAVFLLLALATTGEAVFLMAWSNTQDQFVDDCGTRVCGCINLYGMDLLAPFIYGGIWRFAKWTAFYWSRLPSNICETSCHLGLSVIFLTGYVWIKRRTTHTRDLSLWFLTGVFFAILALGPELHIAGHKFPQLTLPYTLFQKIFPPLKMARTPVRLIVMTILCLSVIAAVGFKTLWGGSRFKQWLSVALLILLFFESLPRGANTPNFRLDIPAYVRVLKNLPGKEAVIMDLAISAGLVEYYQIIHQRPMAFGYLARYPISTFEKDKELRKTITERNFSSLHRDYQFRYLVTKAAFPPPHPAVVFRDGDVKIYDLATQDQR